MKDLDYPFNSDYIIRKKKSLKKQLLADENTKYIGKKIAILGGETTENMVLDRIFTSPNITGIMRMACSLIQT